MTSDHCATQVLSPWGTHGVTMGYPWLTSALWILDALFTLGNLLCGKLALVSMGGGRGGGNSNILNGPLIISSNW